MSDAEIIFLTVAFLVCACFGSCQNVLDPVERQIRVEREAAPW